ncbi:MAG: anti-sigma factor, partial [Chitinophagaceae bacterium]
MPGTNVKTSPDTGSLATVYWDRRTNEVYLLVNKLPEPSSDKQYQLWALVDGKPVDAGVFDARTATALVKMKNITNAQGFAVTLENKGGSIAPTMEQMYVLGNVKT